MVFPKKIKGIFVDVSNYTASAARTSAFSAPMEIEAISSCPADKPGAIASLVDEIQPKRGNSRGFVHAVCGIYPGRRVIRRLTVDAKRTSEEKYLDEMVAAQLKISSEEYLLAVMDASTGLDQHRSPSKDVVVAGLPITDISDQQSKLLKSGVYPRRLELGTLSSIGALIQYLTFKESTTSTLVMEIGQQATETYVIAERGIAASRQIAQGVEAIIPIVQKELGLKDEEAARRLFYSNTFDFTGMASSFTKKLIKELQSSIGFYEVQTGQSIGQVICTTLPARLGWIQDSIAEQLGVETFRPELTGWLKSRGITFAAGVAGPADSSLLGLYGLMATK